MAIKSLDKASHSISLCMIVKNEEKYLEECLTSVRECADEIIVVDTGSSDRTVEIARSFHAEVFLHPWENDFSKHRNQSLGYAGGEWILWMDADERLEPGGSSSIREAVTLQDADSLLLTMVCFFDNRTRQSWNNAIKLFRNHRGIHFEGIVHNRVVGCQSTKFCPAKIYHLGYDIGAEDVRKKFLRTSTLLRRAIEEEPLNFKHHHDLAVALSSVHRFRAAVQEGLTAIRLHEQALSSDINILWTYFVVASSYYNLRLPDEARSVAEKALSLNPDHFDSYFVLASVCADQDDMDGFSAAYDRFVEATTRYRENPHLAGPLLVNKIDEQWRLEIEYGRLLLKRGKHKEAEEKFLIASRISSDPAAAFRLAAAICRDHSQPASASRLLGKALESGIEPHRGKFEKALNRKAEGQLHGYSTDIRHLLGLESKPPELLYPLGVEALKIGEYASAEEHLSDAIGKGYDHPEVYNGLALACKYQGKIEEAMKWNRKALESDEENANALAHLGHLSYDQKAWDSAKRYYSRSLIADPRQKSVLFHLSLLALMDQDLPACVSYCDRLMELLDLPRERVIERIQDIGTIYEEVGHAFHRLGENRMHQEALSFSNSLKGKPQ
ncbi:MAG: glycosyltransferase [Desulfobacteraceae bacterium]|nr:MAG: glycosyltransferase [Desulfobacteraceae bacterium]